MRKDRNTFFTNYNAQTSGYIPSMPNAPMVPNNNYGPYQASQTNSSYYSGPDLGISNEIDNRLSKIERQINRLDNRLTKLENNIPNPSSNTEINENNYSNMYML